MIALRLYRAATTLGEPLIRGYLRHRQRRGREDSARCGERIGIASAPRPDAPLVWLHAASVGESLSVLRLIGRLADERPDLGLLVTTGTVTSAGIMASRLPARAIHQYVPVDRLPWIRRFLDYWRPSLVLWVESEFWPNLVTEIAARGIPMVLLNARISPRSHRGWKRWPRTIARLLDCFDLCLAQSPADRDKLLDLGARTVKCPGNLKFAAEALPVDAAALDALKADIGNRPRWIAASTHPGEEDAAAAAHRLLRQGRPGLLTIIVPRHPARGPGIAEELRARGFRTQLRSAGGRVNDATELYIADSVGELGLFYRLCPIAFVGGSLVPHGGQNVLEPAKLGCAVLHGPHMFNFEEIAGGMRRAGAATEIADAAGLAEAVAARLDDAALLRAQVDAATRFADAQQGILDSVMDEIAPLLQRLEPIAKEPGTGMETTDHAARA
jgi:3-deoxy-D-manno-octulosonic-acid transferase